MAKKQIDWEAIEREYRAGQLSIREIARQHEISDPAILRRAKKEGWERDLSEKVRQKVNAKLVSTDVSAKVSSANTRETIDNAANRGVEIVRSHRQYLGRLLRVTDKCLKDLENDCDQEDQSLKMGYKEKAELLKATTQSLAKAIPLERQAFNLDKEADNGIIVISSKLARGVNEDNL